jgi:hypothetical protein
MEHAFLQRYRRRHVISVLISMPNARETLRPLLTADTNHEAWCFGCPLFLSKGMGKGICVIFGMVPYA